MRPGRIVLSSAALAVMLAACSGAPPGASAGASPGSPAPSANPGGLILRAALEGGFIAPNAIRTRLPIVSVYADGRILSEGVTPAIYPGPLVPPIIVRSVGPAGAAGILKAAADAGLTGGDATYGPGPFPDAATTVITVLHGGGQTVSRFNSLEAQPGASDVSGADARAQAAAAALLGDLLGSAAFGGTPAGDSTYRPLGYQLFVTPGSPAGVGPGRGRPPLSWPLATPLATFGQADPVGTAGARVGVVVGSDAATLGPILEAATQITPFMSGGTQWTIAVKPLLPDEVAALGG